MLLAFGCARACSRSSSSSACCPWRCWPLRRSPGRRPCCKPMPPRPRPSSATSSPSSRSSRSAAWWCLRDWRRSSRAASPGRCAMSSARCCRSGTARWTCAARWSRTTRSARSPRASTAWSHGLARARARPRDLRQVRQPGGARRDPRRPRRRWRASAGGHHPVRRPARLHAVGRGHRAARGRARPQRVLHRDGGGHPRASGGLVLQFIGDEIEAVFGAPVAAPDHADAGGARGAGDARRGWPRGTPARERAGKPPLRHGIGIHTGTVLAGNIGSARAPVLRAGRRCGQPRLAHPGRSPRSSATDILVSGATCARLAAASRCPRGRRSGEGAPAEVEVYGLA